MAVFSFPLPGKAQCTSAEQPPALSPVSPPGHRLCSSAPLVFIFPRVGVGQSAGLVPQTLPFLVVLSPSHPPGREETKNLV